MNVFSKIKKQKKEIEVLKLQHESDKGDVIAVLRAIAFTIRINNVGENVKKIAKITNHD